MVNAWLPAAARTVVPEAFGSLAGYPSPRSPGLAANRHFGDGWAASRHQKGVWGINRIPLSLRRLTAIVAKAWLPAAARMVAAEACDSRDGYLSPHPLGLSANRHSGDGWAASRHQNGV